MRLWLIFQFTYVQYCMTALELERKQLKRVYVRLVYNPFTPHKYLSPLYENPIHCYQLTVQ